MTATRFVFVIAIFLGAPMIGLSQSCDPSKPAPPGMVCQTMLGQAVNGVMDGATAIMKQYGHDIHEEGVALSARLGKARTAYFQTPRTSPNFPKVQAEFATCLTLKDMWFLKVYLIPQEVIDRPYLHVDYMDGGLRRTATRNWERWAKVVKDRAGPQLIGLLEFRGGSRDETVTEALNASAPRYEYYRLSRDWVEFANAGRNVSDDPETYLKYIISMIRPFESFDEHGDLSNPAWWSEQYYGELVDVFGKDLLLRTSKRLMAAHKDREGFLDPHLHLNGLDWQYIWDGYIELLGSNSAHDYIRTIFMRANSGLRLSAKESDKEYKQFVAAYGEKSVLDAAERVRVAPKTMRNNMYQFEDPSALGVPLVSISMTSEVARIYEVFQDILANKYPKGFVRATIAFHDELDSAAAVDQAYEKLTSQYGADTVLTAAAKVRARSLFNPSTYYPVMLKTLDPSAQIETARKPSKGGIPTGASGGTAPQPTPPPSIPLTKTYWDPTMPNYDMRPETASGYVLQYCRGLYDPVGPLLTPEQVRIKYAQSRAIDAEVKNCAALFDIPEILTHRRLALRYCLLNHDYTIHGQAARIHAYSDCMNENDTLTALCTRELRYRSQLMSPRSAPNPSCPAQELTGREVLVLRSGGREDMGHPVVTPTTGPGLPDVLRAPFKPGIIH